MSWGVSFLMGLGIVLPAVIMLLFPPFRKTKRQAWTPTPDDYLRSDRWKNRRRARVCKICGRKSELILETLFDDGSAQLKFECLEGCSIETVKYKAPKSIGETD